MREILTNSRPDGQGVLDGGVDVRRSLNVLELFVNQEGRLLDESRDAPVAAAARRVNEFVQLRHMGDVCRGHNKVEKSFLEFLAMTVQVGEFHSARRQRGSIVRQDYRFRFDLQAVMFGKNVELMHPISK